jgi:PAS domain S-box-containing protein
MQLLKTKRNITITFIAAVLGIIVLLIFFYRNMVQMSAENKSIIISTDRLDKIQHILFDIEAVENTQRGYLISGKESDAALYANTEKTLLADLNIVDNLLKQEADFYSDFKRVKADILKQLVLCKQINDIRKDSGIDAAVKFLNDNQPATIYYDIRKNILSIESRDWEKLYKSFNRNEELSEKRFWQLILLTSSFMILLTLSYININRDLKQKKEKEKILKYNSSIVESISDAIITTDTDYKITGWNKYAEEIFGYSSEEAIGKNILTFLKVSSEKYSIEDIINEFTEKGKWSGEVINYGKGDKRIYADVVSSSIRDDEGKILGGVNVIRDVTERIFNQKQLNELSSYLENEVKVKVAELNLSNERFNLLSKATNDALWDWNIKEDKLWCNKSYYEMTGLNADSHLRFNDFADLLIEEDKDRIIENYKHAVKNKITYISEEYSFRRINNNIINIYNRAYIIYDESGNPIRMLGAMQDITLQKKIQHQIMFEKDLSDTVINSLPGVFYMFNENLKFIRWNKNLLKITGYMPQEIADINPVDFVSPEQQETVAAKIANVFKTGEDTVEADLYTKDKRRISYFFTGMAINYNGENCMMGVGIDVSEKKRSQEELKRLNIYLQNIREEERGRIAREIHDDLGQQLTGLKMEMSLIMKKIKPENIELKSKVDESIQLVDNAVKSVRRIATQLRPSILDDLGLVAALEWLSEEFEKRYHIKTNFSSGSFIKNITPDTSIALFRIYQESLTNILRHSKATEVNATLSEENEVLTLSISDNGIGFEVEKMNTFTTLGLIGIKERTNLIGGSLNIESNKDEGTSLLISVPLIN